MERRAPFSLLLRKRLKERGVELNNINVLRTKNAL